MVSGVIEYAQRMDIALREVLPEAAIGTYLHGSGALGGFVHGLSDVDLLFVIADTGHSRPAAKIGRRLAAAPLPALAAAWRRASSPNTSARFVLSLRGSPFNRSRRSKDHLGREPSRRSGSAHALRGRVCCRHRNLRATTDRGVSGAVATVGPQLLGPRTRRRSRWPLCLRRPQRVSRLALRRAWRSRLQDRGRHVGTRRRISVSRAATGLEQQQGRRKGTVLDSTGATFVAHVRDLNPAHIARAE